MYNLNTQEKIRNYILSSSEIVHNSVSLAPNIEKSIIAIVKCFRRGNKVVLFGNGGSAADAQHIAAEFIGRFKINRKSLPAIALSNNSSTITAISNDVGYENIFINQLKIHYRKGDKLFVISASGNSENIVKAAKWVQSQGGKVLGMLGFDGGILREICDSSVLVTSIHGEYGPVGIGLIPWS